MGVSGAASVGKGALLMKPIARMMAVLLTVATLAAQAPAREPEYGFVVLENVMAPMRDGVRLATDIYLPAKDGQRVEGKWPAILTRTPYNKNGNKDSGQYFAERGYAFVAQDTRGRYASEGVWHMLTDDGPDGCDTAAWLEAQAWSDGQLGMLGTSYVGGTQHAMAMANPPQLKTVIPVDAMSNLGYASMRNGGAFELRFWNWIHLNAARGSRQSRDPATRELLQQLADNRVEYLYNMPLRRGMTPLRMAEEYEDWLVGALEHGGNVDYWRQNNIRDYPETYKDIPVYLVGGWYDSWGGNTTANYRALSTHIKGPVYLIMGSWIHGAQGKSTHGQVNFGPDAAIADPLEWRLEWYDHWLKGLQSKVTRKEAPFSSAVRIFVMGTGSGAKDGQGLLDHGGYWRDEPEWPLARAVVTAFHLQPGGGLATEAPPQDGGATSFVFEPRNPVPTIGGQTSSGNDILVQGARDQRGGEHVWNWQKPVPLSARNDVLVFQTAALPEDIEVTGELEVELWISSSAPDTDFTAKLLDVYPPGSDYPDGFDLIIGDGIIRTRFRDSLKEEKLMEPGTVYPVRIALYPTSNVFKKGHRIRVDISSSNFPRFDVNPNTGEPLNQNRRVQAAVNSVEHNAAHPSRILLPVVPPVTGG